MGWGYAVINGREVGYSVAAVCDHPECSVEIDRGLSFYCGNIPGDDTGCGKFFCESHLEMGPDARKDDDFPRQVCAACRKEWEELLGAEAYCDSGMPRLEEGALPMREGTLYINGVPSPGIVEITSLTVEDEHYFQRLGTVPEPITIEFDCMVQVGIREMRTLFTGRPRLPRAVNKRRNRERRLLRRLLVLDAGERPIAFQWGVGCSTEQALIEFANGRPVSVPRSLRPFLGRWVGGSK